MAIRELPRVKTRYYTVDDVWAMENDPANENRYFYLIDGELYEDPMPNWTHGDLQLEIGTELRLFLRKNRVGKANTEVGSHPANARDTLLMPDVAFYRFDRLPNFAPDGYVPTMPDIAIEINSPGNSMPQLRLKAETYLRHGSQIVWLVLPEREGVEQWTLDEDGRMQSEFIDRNGALDGGDALPGFSLPLSQLFPQ